MCKILFKNPQVIATTISIFFYLLVFLLKWIGRKIYIICWCEKLFAGGGKLFGNKRIGDLQTLSQPKRARVSADSSSSRKAGGTSSRRKPVFVNQQPLLDLSQERMNIT